MYDTHDYLWGVGVYALGGLLVMLFLWLYCRKIPWQHLRNLILLLCAVIIFTPVSAYPDKGFLAPAWFVSFYEALTIDEPNSFLRGLTPLLSIAILSILGYVAGWVLTWYLRRRSLTDETKHETINSLEPETHQQS